MWREFKNIEDFCQDFIDKCIVTYGRYNTERPGVPNFRPITDKSAFRKGEFLSLEKGECPLDRQPRLQLYLSERFIKDTLPGLWEKLCVALGACTLVFSLLWSEGINWYR